MVSLYKTSESRVIKGKYFTSEDKGVEFRGLSDDEKPTDIDGKDIPNGSVFIEMDTLKIYFWDSNSEEWVTSE